jgi:hypothetical protein
MLDMDGVLADFTQGFTALAWTLFGTPLMKVTDAKHWDDFGGLTKEQIGEVWKQLHANPKFWESLPACVDQETLDRIDDIIEEGHAEIYFVTNRSSKHAKRQTENWLIAHGIENPTVITTGMKAEVAKAIGIHYSLEDKPSNADMIAWWSQDTQSFILTRPYNSGVHAPQSKKVKRVATVNDFLNVFDVPYGRSSMKDALDVMGYMRKAYPEMFIVPGLFKE